MTRRAHYQTALLLPLVLSSTGLAYAEDTESNPIVLNSVTVESTRLNTTVADSPQVITVINRQQIEEQLRISSDSSQVLSNLLPAYAPNTQKLNNSSQSFRGRTVLYMIDGVPQSNPLREGSRSAHTIDLAMVDHIEVVHGASAIHGLGATGGIINFITKSTRSDDLKQHIDIQMTSPLSELNSDTSSYKLGYRAEGRKGNFDYLFGLTGETQGAYLDSDNNYVGINTLRGEISDSTGYDLFTKIGYWFNDDQSLVFETNRYSNESDMNYVGVAGDRDNGIATGAERATPFGEASFNKVRTSSLTYNDSNLAGMDFTASLFHQDFKARYGTSGSNSFQDASIAPIGTLLDQTQSKSEKVGAKISLIKDDLLDHSLKITTGLDLLKDTTQQDLILTGRTYVPKTSYENYAPFVQAEFKPTDRIVLQAGARHERAQLNTDTYQTVAANNGVTVEGGSPSFSDTVYNAGAVFKLTPQLSTFANYSQGFGMPDVGRVLRGVKTTGENVETLIDLSPIVTDNNEIGFRFNRDAFDFEMSYYESNSDLGSRLVVVDGLYRVKREKVEIDGIEASFGYQANADHRLELNYSHVNGKSDRDNDGKVETKLTGSSIAPDRLIASWNGRWNDKLTSFLQVSHAFDRSFDDDALAFDGYTLVDTSIGYTLPVGQMNVSVANLFNEDYFTYYSQSGIKEDASYFKGRGRTLTVGYGFDF